MMWLSSLLLLVAFSSVLGQLEDLSDAFENCGKGFEELDVESLEKESGEVQMEAMCPPMLEAFRCVDRIFAEQVSMSLEELADMIGDNEEIGKMLHVVVNTKSVIIDVCTEGTQLNNDVKADMQCFESIDEEEALGKCREKATVYGIFTDISNEIEEADSDFDPEFICQDRAFLAACVSFLVHETCGQRAFNTFNTILKRTTVFQNVICSKEKLEEMKTTLIEKLDMSETEKELFKLGLDLKRRRK